MIAAICATTAQPAGSSEERNAPAGAAPAHHHHRGQRHGDHDAPHALASHDHPRKEACATAADPGRRATAPGPVPGGRSVGAALDAHHRAPRRVRVDHPRLLAGREAAVQDTVDHRQHHDHVRAAAQRPGIDGRVGRAQPPATPAAMADTSSRPRRCRRRRRARRPAGRPRGSTMRNAGPSPRPMAAASTPTGNAVPKSTGPRHGAPGSGPNTSGAAPGGRRRPWRSYCPPRAASGNSRRTEAQPPPRRPEPPPHERPTWYSCSWREY